MNDIENSTVISNETFSINWIEDYIYYDGPVLSLIKSNEKTYFYLWADSDDECNRWLAITVSEEQIEQYKDRKLTLLDIVNSNPTLFYVDIDNDLKISRTMSVDRTYVKNEFLPSEDSFYDSSLRG
jgi:hypothetical protein